MGIGGQRVMRAETTGPTMDKVSFTLRESAGSLYKIYIAFTIIELVLLMFGGMSLYDSLIHTSGTMGTGGFSNYAASVGHFNSVYIDIIISVFMLACGVNFGLYHRIFYGKKLSALKDPELRFYLATVGVSTIFIAVVLTAKGFNGFGESLRQAFFQVSSIITTTGFATADFNVWPLCTKILLIILMLMGSCASSTGGGLKVVRIILLIKMMRRASSRRIHPNSVEPIKLGDKTLQETTIQATAAFVFLYLAITMFCIFAVSFENIDFETCISSVVACISNIGPGFGMVGPTGNYAFFSPFSKILLALAMIAGRLELYAIVLPLSPRFWNSGR
jgi:trk system potassium uptake protein TrkH